MNAEINENSQNDKINFLQFNWIKWLSVFLKWHFFLSEEEQT